MAHAVKFGDQTKKDHSKQGLLFYSKEPTVRVHGKHMVYDEFEDQPQVDSLLDRLYSEMTPEEKEAADIRLEQTGG